MRRVALAVGADRRRIGRGRGARGGEVVLRRTLAQHVEEVAVGRLWAVAERAAEIVEQHDRPSLCER